MVATLFEKVPLFVRSPVRVIPAAAVALLQVPPLLIVSEPALTEAPTVRLTAPLLLMVTLPNASEPVALVIASLPLKPDPTEVFPVTVSG